MAKQPSIAWAHAILAAAVKTAPKGPADLAAEAATDAPSPPDTINVPNADPEMAAAQAKARATLQQFWMAYNDPGPADEGFALKVAIPYGCNNSEHVWTDRIEVEAGKITGVVGNEPRYARAIRSGQRIEIAEGRVSDWMFMRAGKIVGNHTMRPLLKRMPPAEAARYRAMFLER
jgi:uncharacterized protein YegJ (DUF2314 family)